MAGIPNGEDKTTCPLAPNYKQLERLGGEMLRTLEDIRDDQKVIKNSLVGPATNPDRVDMRFVRESNKRGDWALVGLLAFNILTIIWFTGVQPRIEKKSGDSSFSAGFGSDSSGENRLQPHQ